MSMPDAVERMRMADGMPTGPAQQVFKDVVLLYLQLHEALADDQYSDAQKTITGLKDSMAKVVPESKWGAAWTRVRGEMASGLSALAKAKSLDGMRRPFRDVSQGVASLLNALGNVTNMTLRLAHCPMALDGEGGEWIQRGTTVANPYYGHAMYGCGSIQRAVESGAMLPNRGTQVGHE